MDGPEVSAPTQAGFRLSRGMRPASELAAGRPHGDRLRYIGGCRCDECRRANARYEQMRIAARRAGDWNGLVDAQRVRAHLQALASRGIGRRTVSDVADVAETTVVEILSGRKATIRARTERALLAVGDAAAADGALVPASGSWRLLDELLEDGYTRASLALQLGCKTPRLQIGRQQVTVRTRHDIERLYAKLHFVDARESIRQLNELHGEGYRAIRIEREVTELAVSWKLDEVPALTPRRGRLHHMAVRLIAAVHSRLTD